MFPSHDRPDTKPIDKVDFSNLGKSGTQPNTVPSSSLPSGFTVTNPKPTTVTGNRLVTTTTTVPTVSTITVPSGSTGIPAGWNPAGVRAGESRGDVIVNVNSPSVIDEEGFTRAVITALNNSQARSGGGGGQLML